MYYIQQYFAGKAPEYIATSHIQTTIHLCRELFLDELNAGLTILGCLEFISYKDVDKINALVLNPLLDLLGLFYWSDRKNASEAARDLIRRMQELGTDDDTFPEYEIDNIRETAHLANI